MPFAGSTGDSGFAQPPPPPPQRIDADQANEQALVMVRAMINAAKADGQIDAEENQKIVDKLSGAGPQAIAFVREEMAKPLNMDFLVGVNPAMATEIYTVSLMAIELDTMAEVNYLKQLSQRLDMDESTVNRIHRQLGVAPIFV